MTSEAVRGLGLGLGGSTVGFFIWKGPGMEVQSTAWLTLLVLLTHPIVGASMRGHIRPAMEVPVGRGCRTSLNMLF